MHPIEIQRYAGVPGENLQKLVFKELADNALDAGYSCEYGAEYIGDGSPRQYIFIQDDGPGLPGDSISDWCDLFSVSRNLKSSKTIRKPTRGALGNGLRVVSGYVHIDGGKLIVQTKGHRFRVVIDEQTGIAHPADIEECECTGTRIEVYLSHYREDCLSWVKNAVYLSKFGETYSGKTSAYWYDKDTFYNLCRSSPGDCSIRQLVEQFDGCTGKKAADICREFKETSVYKLANALTRKETGEILTNIRNMVNPVSHQRLGFIGPDAFKDQIHGTIYYEKVTGDYHLLGSQSAIIPVVIEAWVMAGYEGIDLTINRTPITGTISMNHWKEEKQLGFSGCGLSKEGYWYTITDIKKPVYVRVNITAPYMPILSSGKAPDLSHIRGLIVDAIGKAAKRAIRNIPAEPKEKRMTIKDAVYGLIEPGRKLAGDGLRFTQRQLFYSIRDNVYKLTGKVLQWGTFTGYTTDYENDVGDIRDMTRDPRGFIKHPHIEYEIPLGTESVEIYRRPEWNYNKILFIEKEGFVQILNQLKWPEKHDCAVMTSKGMPTRAVRDLIDKIAARADEPVTVFCLHDADAAGTRIYQSLQEETKARPGRLIKIVNLGLEPWEALEMGLSVENVKYTDNKDNTRYQAVADYIKERTDQDWGTWLQTHRVELNAIVPSRKFVDWLDSKIALYEGKVIPPKKVVNQETHMTMKQMIRARVLDEYEKKIEEEVDKRYERLKSQSDFSLVYERLQELKPGIENSWRDVVSNWCKSALEIHS